LEVNNDIPMANIKTPQMDLNADLNTDLNAEHNADDGEFITIKFDDSYRDLDK
jgi:hypothetical protein